MLDAELNAIQALCDAATPGGWFAEEANALFTAAARKAIPKLIAEVRRLNKALDCENSRIAEEREECTKPVTNIGKPPKDPT